MLAFLCDWSVTSLLKNIESTPDEDPWKNIFGMHKDNSLFNEVLAEIEAERAKLDAKMEEYYKQIDSEQG